MNIALPNISRSFAGNDAATAWVVNAYQLSGTVCLLPVSSMVETLGLKRIYAAGLTIFVLASLACAFAPTLPVLVGARLIQGAGAAGLSVAGIALVRVVNPRGMISKGLALVALAVAIPGALGPAIAAAILAVAKWPWLFLVNLPFGLAVPLFINAAPPDVRFPRALDLTGTALNAFGFGLFVIGVGTLGSSDARIGIGEIVAGVFCFWSLHSTTTEASHANAAIRSLSNTAISLVGVDICLLQMRHNSWPTSLYLSYLKRGCIFLP